MADHALATVLAEARDYVRQAKAASTVRAYRADWRHFGGWCTDRSREALPRMVKILMPRDSRVDARRVYDERLPCAIGSSGHAFWPLCRVSLTRNCCCATST